MAFVCVLKDNRLGDNHVMSLLDELQVAAPHKVTYSHQVFWVSSINIYRYFFSNGAPSKKVHFTWTTPLKQSTIYGSYTPCPP